MHDFDPNLRRRWQRLGVLSAAALLLHVAVLGGADWVWPAAEPVRLPSAMQVRVVEPASLQPAPLPADATEATPLSIPMQARPAVVRARPAALSAMPVLLTPVVERVAGDAVVAPSMQVALATPAASSSAPSADDEVIPHYRTRMPPAATLRYEVSRGMLHGTGDLVWRPQADRYELRLDFKLSGLTILSQASSGVFDAAGIAPLRFTDQRFKRGTTAANFQREADKISYSGSSKEFALRAGAQDRLSWMMQLAAIVSAEPQLAKPGGKVAMYVTGANGDAGVWVFRCVGPESIEARGGSVDTIKFVREPRDLHDTTVQVWLDPKQHDLPTRATQKSGPDDEGYELRLLEVVAPS